MLLSGTCELLKKSKKVELRKFGGKYPLTIYF